MPWVYNPFLGTFDFTNPSGGAPSGAAGGDLAGTYPNPTIGLNKVTDSKLAEVYVKANGTVALIADWAVGSKRITGLLDPAALQDAATKNYVDQVAGGIEARQVRLATAAALPASNYLNGVAGVGATITATGVGQLTVDGVNVTVGDRILVKNETSLRNGVYVVTVSGAGATLFILTRALDSDDTDDFASVLVFVTAGTANANTSWLCTAGTTIVVGTDPITFTQYQVGQGTTVGGDLTGTVGNAALVTTAVTPGTYGSSNNAGTAIIVPSFTVDSKGRITAASASASLTVAVDPFNWWWIAEPTQTASTTIVYTPTSSATVATTNNPTLTAFNDATGLYIDVAINTGASATVWIFDSNGALLDYQNLPKAYTKIKTGTTISTSTRYWFAITGTALSSGNLTSDVLGSGKSLKGAGFRYSTNASDTNWMAQTFNGTTETTQSTGVAVTTNTRYEMIIDFSNYPTDVKFYINGTLTNTITTTLPGTATDTCGVALGCDTVGGGSIARSMRWARFHVVGQS